MIKTQDPYKLGYSLGLQGIELPDEEFTLFSWLGWVTGISARNQPMTQVNRIASR